MNDASADSVEDLLRIESVLGKELPADYKDWLSDDGSNLITPNKITIPSDPPWTDTVTKIFPADEVVHYLEMEQEMEVVGSRDFPEGMFPIAENGMGDYYLMSVSDADFGSVFFLFHEESNADEGLWGLYPMGSGFTEWSGTIEKGVPVQRSPEVTQIATPIRMPDTKKHPEPWWRFW